MRGSLATPALLAAKVVLVLEDHVVGDGVSRPSHGGWSTLVLLGLLRSLRPAVGGPLGEHLDELLADPDRPFSGMAFLDGVELLKARA